MNRTQWIDLLINGIITLIFLLGILIAMKREWIIFYGKIKMHRRLWARRSALKEKKLLMVHFEQLLLVCFNRSIQPKTFLLIEGILFSVLVLIGMQATILPKAVITALVVTLLPYLFLRVRLEVGRRKGSFEGERLISAFLSHYRMCNFNIYHAIESIIKENKDTKISNRLLFKLLMEIRNTGSKEVIRRATESFAYGINTNWSRMLAHNIRIGAETGINVSLAIEDILIQLREARSLMEGRKRLNAEAVRMVLFLVPLMYVGTVIMSIRYLAISPKHFLENQLYTEQGFFFFIAILFLFLVNLTVMEIVNNQRFDY